MRSYGIKEQIQSDSDLDVQVEQLGLLGYVRVDSGYSEDEQARIAQAFERAYERQVENHGGHDALLEIDEHHSIRAPLIYEDALLNLAMTPAILALAERVFRGRHDQGAYLLNQQNGIINPGGETYNQGAWHRDLPYQHFTASRPVAINALYCIEPFTEEELP